MLSRVHDTLYDQIGVHFKKGNPVRFVQELDVVAQILTNYLGAGKKYAVGEDLTFTDFSYFELLDFMNHYSEGETFGKYPLLK